MPPKDPESVRRRLVTAAIDLASTQRLELPSLDAVSAAAGVSKGGLLHHFPSKDALWHEALAETTRVWARTFNETWARRAPGSVGRWTKANLEVNFLRDKAFVRAFQTCQHLLFQHPDWAPLCDALAPSLVPERPQDGYSDDRWLVIRSACDGMWLRFINGWTPGPEPWEADLERALWRLADV